MIPKARVDMGYIEVILLVNIGLTFAVEILGNINYPNEKIEVITQKIPDEYLDKDIIHFPDYVYPTHYKVQLTVDTNSSYPIISLSGQVDISITITPNNTIQTLLLHARNIVLDNRYTVLRNTKEIYFVDKSYTIQEEFLAIKFMSKVPPDNYTLTAVFHSTASTFIRYELHKYQKRKHKYAYIFGLKNTYSDLLLMPFWEQAARHLFPCWDDPAYKTTFDIEVTHEAEYTALSNMPVSENYDINNGHIMARMKRTKFITTPMMSTHQLVILFVPSNLIDTRETVHTWHKSNTTSIISLIHSTVDDTSKYLLEYTKTPLDNQKIDHVLVPNAPCSKAELGLIIYRESEVIYDENKDPISVKSEVKNTIEFQVAHLWFGGLVTPKFWTDRWLTESFAFYFSHYFPKQAKLWEEMPKWDSERFDKAVQLKIVEKYHDVLRSDRRAAMPPVLSGLQIYGDDLYHKGAFILRMFSGMFTEAKFREIVIEYLNKHKYGLVTSDDLWSILQNKKDSEDSFKFAFSEVKNIKEVLKPWITQQSFPIIEVWQQSDNWIKLTQRSSNPPFNYTKWWIPVTYMTSTDASLSRLTFQFRWLKPMKSLQLQLTDFSKNNDSWFIINVGQIGYYRVRYESENWKRLGYFLKRENYSRIPILNRAQLIDDICDNFKYKRTDWDLFEHITSYLSRETDYIPWVPMLKCLDILTEFFKLPESKWYQMHIGNYFNLILNEIGYEEDPNDDDIKKKARQNLAFYACTLGNPTCRSAAADKLKKYLADPTIYKILPWWENWTFCFGLKTENVSMWEQVYQLYAETKKKLILNSLSCTEDPNIIIKFLYIIAENNTLIGEADQSNLFDTIIKQHIGNNQILSYIMDNIKILKPKSSFLVDAFDTIVMNIYSDEQLDKLMMTATDDFYIYKTYNMITITRQRQKIKALKRFPDRNKPI